MKASRSPLIIGGVEIPAGRRTDVELRVARLPTGTWVSLSVAVLRGSRPGPCVWLAAALHGDELNGIDTVRRVLPQVPLEGLRGTIIAVPIVNVFGFIAQSRYLPDRRDLNRTFPGSPRGSLASRIAHLFMKEIVAPCDYGIDFHTGSNHRTNLPQIRADLNDPQTRALTEAFRAPLAINSQTRDGSLRAAAARQGCRVLLYEAGETLRFNRYSIQLGVRGTLRVLHKLRMTQSAPSSRRDPRTQFANESQWVRAPRGGLLLMEVEPGDRVARGQVLARITDTFSDTEREIRAPFPGLVAGLTINPVVNRGDAMVHLAKLVQTPDPSGGPDV